MNLIQVDIIALTQSPTSPGAFALVLEEMGGNRRLPIIIGAQEARAITLGLEHDPPARPMTHDLIPDIMAAAGMSVKDVIIDELRKRTFFAKIRYSWNGEEGAVDARPSDAVALAVRLNVAVYVAPSVLNEAGMPIQDEQDQVLEEYEEEEVATDEAHRLELLLERAAKSEDYDERARWRSEAAAIMESHLKRAVESEEYEEAARWRDMLAALKEKQRP